MAFIDVIGLVLPVLLLFALGAILRTTGFLAAGTIADLRRFVLAIALPSALFLTFLRVSLELRYLPIVVIVFLACAAMLVAGPGLAGSWAFVLVRRTTAYGVEVGCSAMRSTPGSSAPTRCTASGSLTFGQVCLSVWSITAPEIRRATGRAPGASQTLLAFLRTPPTSRTALGVAFKPDRPRPGPGFATVGVAVFARSPSSAPRRRR